MANRRVIVDDKSTNRNGTRTQATKTRAKAPSAPPDDDDIDGVGEVAEPKEAKVPAQDDIDEYLDHEGVGGSPSAPKKLGYLATTIRRPYAGEFYRVLPGVALPVLLYKPPGRSNKLYAFNKKARPHLLAKRIGRYELRLAVSSQSPAPFLIPIPELDSEALGASWADSQRDNAKLAEVAWLSQEADTVSGKYIPECADDDNDLGEPQFPEVTIKVCWNAAIKNQKIDGPQHPLVLAAKGK